MKRPYAVSLLLLLFLLPAFAQEPSSEDKHQFIDDQDYGNEELFPPELPPDDTPTAEPWVEADTDKKGIYYEIHYDEFERAFKVEDYFIRGYRGVSEYEFFPKLQKKKAG